MLSSLRTRLATVEGIALGTGVILVGVCMVLFFLLKQQYSEAFYPGIYIDNVLVTNKSPQEARLLLQHKHKHELDSTITLSVDDIQVASSAAELGGQRNIDEVVSEAFAVGHQESFFLQAWRLLNPVPRDKHFVTTFALDEAKVELLVSELKKAVDTPYQYPEATLLYSGSPASLRVHPGKQGRELDLPQTTQQVIEQASGESLSLPATVASTSSQLSPEQSLAAAQRAQKYVGKSLTFRADNVYRQLTDQDLVSLLAFPEGFASTKLRQKVSEWDQFIQRAPQNAEFEYDAETLQVKKFSPPRKGLALNETQLEADIIEAMALLESSDVKEETLSMPVRETDPEMTLEKTNQLGIKERIGFGESLYHHSIPNRVHNVALTAGRINNVIVKPGDEFSFNKTLGEVSASTGYRTAYVIKNGRTELGDGGGVCQVSTTLFRSVLNAGLQVTRRLPHSYRVSYYELNSKPGVDATVYAGEVDFRFKNDTNHHILIHTQTDSQNLYMTVEIYGTSDGRTAEIVDHKTYDFRAAPAPLYIEDPTLPRGQVKQIDFAASGIKASFKNVIKDKDGNVLREDQYFSNYKPWQAVYLKGTG